MRKEWTLGPLSGEWEGPGYEATLNDTPKINCVEFMLKHPVGDITKSL